MSAAEHNPGEPEFGEHADEAEHNPGEFELGEGDVEDEDEGPSDAGPAEDDNPFNPPELGPDDQA